MNASIIVKPQEAIAEFVRARIGFETGTTWGECRTLGLVRNATLAGGVIYNHFSKYSCCAHIAGLPNKQWLTPEFLFAMFDYPFRHIGLQRITGLVPENNKAAIEFDEHLGFVREGRMRGALPGGEGLLVYGMLKEECKWISEKFSQRVLRRVMMRSGSPSAALH